MKKGFLLVALLSSVMLVSCKKKYDCTCQTEVYDSQGYYVTTYYETHTVKARPLTASTECYNMSSNNSSCYLN